MRQLLIEALQVRAEHAAAFADQLAKDFDPFATLKNRGVREVVNSRCGVKAKGRPHGSLAPINVSPRAPV